jgi:hypothetical protein
MRQFTPDQELRALSWRQPFAELMLHGKIETRKWSTDYRGWVLICASQKPYSETELMRIAGESGAQNILTTCLDKNISERFGQAIAIGYLSDCVHWAKLHTEINDKLTFVKRNNQLYLHFYEDVKPIVPFNWKGTQRWSKAEQSIKEKIYYELRS